MLLTIVLLVFALHVVAWLVLPAGRARVDRTGVHLYRHAATAMPMAIRLVCDSIEPHGRPLIAAVYMTSSAESGSTSRP